MLMRGFLLLLAIGALVAGVGFGGLYKLRQERRAEQIEINALQKQVAEMERRLAAMDVAEENGGISLPVISAPDALAAELDLQARILDLASEYGVTLSSFGAAPVPVETSQDALGFEMEFEASHDEAVQLIEAVENSTPPVAIHALWLRHLPVGSLGDAVTPVSVRIALWAFWAPSEPGRGQGG